VAVVVLGITGVAIAASNDNPEIKGTSTKLSYNATLNRSQDCLNRSGQATGDRLLTFTLNGSASGGEDPELNGPFSARVKELVDQDRDRASAGVFSIGDQNQPRTVAGFAAVDRNGGDDAMPAPLGDPEALQGLAVGRTFNTDPTRLLLGNLTLVIPDAGGSGDGQIGKERRAGDDAVLVSGFCDVNKDGRDDFGGDHPFS
jgi:hypothetical protein